MRVSGYRPPTLLPDGTRRVETRWVRGESLSGYGMAVYRWKPEPIAGTTGGFRPFMPDFETVREAAEYFLGEVD